MSQKVQKAVALHPFVVDLMQRCTIQKIVEEYVPLTRAGKTLKGLCPFHVEQTPSFHVHPDKGFFHCFGCGAGGDVLKFLERREHLSFVMAVAWLANKCGLSVPDEVIRTGGVLGEYE